MVINVVISHPIHPSTHHPSNQVAGRIRVRLQCGLPLPPALTRDSPARHPAARPPRGSRPAPRPRGSRHPRRPAQQLGGAAQWECEWEREWCEWE